MVDQVEERALGGRDPHAVDRRSVLGRQVSGPDHASDGRPTALVGGGEQDHGPSGLGADGEAVEVGRRLASQDGVGPLDQSCSPE